MTQKVLSNDTVWVTAADDPKVLEYFFIHSGKLELSIDGELHTLCAGDSFSVIDLKEDFIVKAKEDTVLLYVTNGSMFDSNVTFQEDLKKLLMQINEKDHYTYRHSGNVMRYTIRLFEYLREYCSDVSVDDMIVASLFHDVGKCSVPDDVLNKKGELTSADIRYLYKHPLNSARLLRPNFGDRIADIAQNHHERLDGSGYPFGLTGDELSMEAKILAVADAFDAMTTDRGYNRVKTMCEAASELFSMTDVYDARVTDALVKLVAAGAFDKEETVHEQDR